MKGTQGHRDAGTKRVGPDEADTMMAASIVLQTVAAVMRMPVQTGAGSRVARVMPKGDRTFVKRIARQVIDELGTIAGLQLRIELSAHRSAPKLYDVVTVEWVESKRSHEEIPTRGMEELKQG